MEEPYCSPRPPPHEMKQTLIGLCVDFALPPPPPPQPVRKIRLGKQWDPKLIERMKKFKFSRRTKLLSKPRNPVKRPASDMDIMEKDEGVEEYVKSEPILTMRQEHLALPLARRIKDTQKHFSHLGSDFNKKMSKIAKQAWNSMYNYYTKAEYDLKHKKSKWSRANLKSPKDPEEIEKEEAARIKHIAELAQPKKFFEGDSLPPRKFINLMQIQNRLAELSEPKADLSMPPKPLPCPVSKAARMYQITPQIQFLNQTWPKRYRVKPWQPLPPGGVKRGALKYNITDRVLALSVPKKYSVGKESDVKENAFTISPNALKYKPSPRILELARPKTL